MSPKRKQSQTPQARWSRRMKAMGRCARCGAKRADYRQLCNPCQDKQTAYMSYYRSKKETANVNA